MLEIFNLTGKVAIVVGGAEVVVTAASPPQAATSSKVRARARRKITVSPLIWVWERPR